MRVLITGATGLLGAEICSLLRGENYQIYYLTTSRNKIVDEINYKGFYWDPSSNIIDVKCFDGVEAVINLAGSSIAKRWTKNEKEKILDSRLNSLRTLKHGLEVLVEYKVKHLISASAIGIYPNSLTNYYNEESLAIDKSFLGRVVNTWEEETKTFIDMGVSVSILRLGLVLSDKGGVLPKIKKPIQNYLGAVLSSGDQWQSWIHIEDVVQIFYFILKHNLEGVYNAVAPNPVTQLKFTKEIARAIGRPVWLPNIPEWFLKLLLGEMSYLIISGQRVSSKKIQQKGYFFKYSSFYQAVTALT